MNSKPCRAFNPGFPFNTRILDKHKTKVLRMLESSPEPVEVSWFLTKECEGVLLGQIEYKNTFAPCHLGFWQGNMI